METTFGTYDLYLAIAGTMKDFPTSDDVDDLMADPDTRAVVETSCATLDNAFDAVMSSEVVFTLGYTH